MTDAALERKGPTFARQQFSDLRLGKRDGHRDRCFFVALRPQRSIVTFPGRDGSEHAKGRVDALSPARLVSGGLS